MNIQIKIEIIKTIAGVLIGSGLLGHVIMAWLNRKRKIAENKEKIYKSMLHSLRGFYTGTNHQEAPKLKQAFIKEYYGSWLYCPDSVVRAINNFFQAVRVKPQPSTEEQKKRALFEVFLAMRKDMGIKTNLEYDDFETWIAT